MRTRQGNRRRSGGGGAGTSQPGCGGMSQLPTCQHGHTTGHLGWAVVLIFHLNVTVEAGGRGLSRSPLSQPLDLCLGSSALLQSFGLIWASNPKIKFKPSDGKIDHLDRHPLTTVPAAVTNQSLAGCHHCPGAVRELVAGPQERVCRGLRESATVCHLGGCRRAPA